MHQDHKISLSLHWFKPDQVQRVWSQPYRKAIWHP